MASASPVLTFPLPAIAGGGKASIGVKVSDRPGHVDLVITSPLLNGTVTVPASEATAFGDHLARLAIASTHPLAKVRL